MATEYTPLPQHHDPQQPGHHFDMFHTVELGRIIESDPRYREPDAMAPYGWFDGRFIIGRDTPVNKGVQPSGAEILVIDDEGLEDIYDPAYEQVLQTIAARSKTATTVIDKVLQPSYRLAQQILRYDRPTVDAMTAAYYFEPMNLAEFIKRGRGVCRQQAALEAYWLERLQRNGLLSLKSDTSLNRSERSRYGRAEDAHEWTRFVDAQGQVYVIDPAKTNNGVGRIEDFPSHGWDYRQPEEIEAARGNVIRRPEFTPYGKGISIGDERHNGHNQDTYFASDRFRSYGVFGSTLGNHPTDRAARLVANALAQTFRRDETTTFDSTQAETTVRNALQYANYELALTKETASAGVLQLINTTSGIKAIIGRGGNVRAYRLGRDGNLHDLTRDDTMPGTMWSSDRQRKLARASSLDELSEEERQAFYDQDRTVLPLGSSKSNVTVQTIKVQPGDRFLLVSGPVHFNLREQDSGKLLTNRTDPPRVVAGNIVQAARNRGHDRNHFRHKTGNMTAVVVDAPATVSW